MFNGQSPAFGSQQFGWQRPQPQSPAAQPQQWFPWVNNGQATPAPQQQLQGPFNAQPTNKPMGNPWEGPAQSPWGQQPQPGQMPDIPQQQFAFAAMPREEQPRGMTGGEFLQQMAGAHLGNFMGAGQRVADAVNSGYGILQQSMTNAADRQERARELRARERMMSQLTRALLGGGGMNGGEIRDTASPLRVGNGTVTTNITAQPLSMADILRADDNVRNTPVGNYDPTRTFQPGAQGELNQMMLGRLRQVAPNVERSFTDQNSQFARDIQGARSQQFQGLGGLLAAMQGDQVSRQGRNARLLAGMIG